MMLRLLVCLFAVASAFELPMSRRALLARAATAAPFVAAAPAFAAGGNAAPSAYYTLVPRKPTSGVTVDANAGKGNQEGKAVTDTGSSLPAKGTSLGDTYSVANYAKSGSTLPADVKSKAMARLMK